MSDTLLSVVVGSRLHGLNNETSDYDIRGIFMHPLPDLLSPFKSLKTTSWIEGDEDNTAYELRDFCKLAAYGNPSILEVLWSDMVRSTSPIAEELRANRHRFLDSKRIFEAHRGYARNQYAKMNLFEADARTPKFAVAYLRSLHQGIQLLQEGTFDPRPSGELREFLLEAKYHWRPELIPLVAEQSRLMQEQLAQAYEQNAELLKPNVSWIEEFIYRAYTKEGHA